MATLESVKKEITELYSDRDFSIRQALENMEAIQELIEPYIDGLSADIQGAGKRQRLQGERRGGMRISPDAFPDGVLLQCGTCDRQMVLEGHRVAAVTGSHRSWQVADWPKCHNREMVLMRVAEPGEIPRGIGVFLQEARP